MKTYIIPAVITLLAISCKKQTTEFSVSALQQENSTVASNHYIGEVFGGGIVFYVTSGKQHGLIAAPKDLVPDAWSSLRDVITHADDTAVFSGSRNTSLIVKAQGNDAHYAALRCARYTGGNYSDWYLPSLNELKELYKQKNIVGGFSYAWYWSSSETEKHGAWVKSFQADQSSVVGKKNIFYVRPIRAF